jgi:hypothetical protein
VISCFFSSARRLFKASSPGLGLRGMLFLFLQYTCVRVYLCVRRGMAVFI